MLARPGCGRRSDKSLSQDVIDRVRVHGLDDRDVVHNLARVRQQLLSHVPDLPILFKLDIDDAHRQVLGFDVSR